MKMLESARETCNPPNCHLRFPRTPLLFLPHSRSPESFPSISFSEDSPVRIHSYITIAISILQCRLPNQAPGVPIPPRITMTSASLLLTLIRPPPIPAVAGRSRPSSRRCQWSSTTLWARESPGFCSNGSTMAEAGAGAGSSCRTAFCRIISFTVVIRSRSMRTRREDLS